MDSKSKIITLDELKQHNDENSLWIAIYDNVYDLTKFAAEHPGGEEVLLEQAGKDGTAAFEDVGHSSDARDMMKQYQVGILADSDREVTKIKGQTSARQNEDANNTGSSMLSWLIPIGLAVLAVALFRHLGSSSESLQ